MAEFTAFIRHLLETGEARLRGKPALQAQERASVASLLEQAYADFVLDVPGPPLPFVCKTALASGQFFALSCWFLMHRHEQPEEVGSCLVMPMATSAGDHLSADLLLRFAPTVFRRARANAPQDILTRRFAEALRRYPLSGALSDITEPPEPPADLGGHPGLLLLHAERLAANPRPAWLRGAVAPYAELVFSRRGIPLPEPPASVEGVV